MATGVDINGGQQIEKVINFAMRLFPRFVIAALLHQFLSAVVHVVRFHTANTCSHYS